MLDLKGKHLIAGEWVAGEETFWSDPSNGERLAGGFGRPPEF